MKDYILGVIRSEIQQQDIGPLYSIQCDEVTDSSNWSQLGVVLRYTKNKMPVGRFPAYVPCESVTEEALADSINGCLTKSGLDAKCCQHITVDGARNNRRKHVWEEERVCKKVQRKVFSTVQVGTFIVATTI
jgi:hypothetical protein